MIKVNKNDGLTVSFDITSDDLLGQLKEKLADKDFLETVTGISCLHNTYWHALIKPKKFRKVSYHVERVKFKKGDTETDVGEKIVCYADDIQLTILVYYNKRPKMTRIELKKIGKRRFTPRSNTDGPSKETSN